VQCVIVLLSQYGDDDDEGFLGWCYTFSRNNVEKLLIFVADDVYCYAFSLCVIA